MILRKKIVLFVFIILSFGLTGAAIVTGAHFRAGLILDVGSVSETRIRAIHDVVDEPATEANRQAARFLAENLELVFAPDPDTWAIVENNLLILHDLLLEIREDYQLERREYDYAHEIWQEEYRIHNEFVDSEVARILQAHYEMYGIDAPEPMFLLPHPPEEPVWLGISLLMFGVLPFHFIEEDQQTLIDMSDELFESFWDAVMSVAHFVQTNQVLHEIDHLTESFVQRRVRDIFTDRVIAELVEEIVLRHILTNAIPNEAENERRYLAALSNYATEIIHEGEIILDEGEIITEDIMVLLGAMGMLAPESILDNAYQVMGVLFLVAALFVACLMYMAFYTPKLAANLKDAGLLFALYLLTLSFIWVLGDFSYFFLPLLIFPLLTSILIGRRLAMVLSFTLVVICYFIAQSDLFFLLYFMTASFMVCLFSRYTTERAKIILVGVVISLIQFSLSFAILMIVQEGDIFYNLQENLVHSGIAAANGLLTVIICMGSLPFWETLFGVVTPIKLLDLTNPTNILLRRLTIEAPGTYHHSLIVANLAETAAYDIGANTHAARVGGYYHDIGKLKFPHYFVENLDGENPHDHFEPQNSAQLIMSHVSYGLTLAGEHRLPQFVRDIIKEHHGTTLMKYFLTKAINSGITVDEEDFRYPFTVPQTRESAIVMLADSVEAAARSMIPKLKSLDEMKSYITNIVRDKLIDGQLADSQLSIRDVDVICDSFYRVLKGMYHERIAYPAPKKPEEIRLVKKAEASV